MLLKRLGHSLDRDSARRKAAVLGSPRLTILIVFLGAFSSHAAQARKSPPLRPAFDDAPPTAAAEAAPQAEAEAPADTHKSRPAASKAAPAQGADDQDEIEVEATDAEGGAPVDFFGDAYPSMDRIFDTLSARMLRARNFGTLISHRNHEGALQSPFYDLLGFDGGLLKIVLGLRYGISNNWDVGILRQNGTLEIYDTWEFDTRYRILSQAGGWPLDFTLRLGLDWYNMPTNNASGFYFQVLLARVVANRALLGAGVLYANSSSGPFKGLADGSASTAVALQADVRLVESLSLAAEVTFNVSGYHDHYPVITLGPKIVTNRHTFSFVYSNSQFVTADSIVANTYRMNIKDWVLGFLITREIDI